VLLVSTLSILSCIFAAALAGYILLAPHLAIGRNAVASATVLLLLIFTAVILGLRHHAFPRFGHANTVTAVRAAFVSRIAAAVVFPGVQTGGEATPWVFFALVLGALALDGVDGFVARHYEYQSDLGARFDMEIDALLILCLSASTFQQGKAGSWVLLIGLMRYGFVLAQYAAPRLKSPLPVSLRRKLVCVAQVAILCTILLPCIGSAVSTWLAGIALALLSYSFAIDCLHLVSEAEVSE